MNSMFTANVTAATRESKNSSNGEGLTLDELVFAERFLHGDPCADPIHAHQIVKAIHAAGSRRYPTLWQMADRHLRSYEAPTLEALSKLATIQGHLQP